MYERNAIVLERYFDKLFGYDEKNNIKSNYDNYIDLVEKLEKYQETVQEEDKVIAEYDDIIGKIQNIQKKQETLYKKNARLLQNRNSVFESIDESVENLRKKLGKIESETITNNEEMKINGENFINELNQFNEKSENRNECSRNRRIVESNYQKQLKETVNDINGIDGERVNTIKNFFKTENSIFEEIENRIMKNGEKEKIPFNNNVIKKAIDIQIEIENKQIEILYNVYEKTNKLLTEIKNDTVKLDKHKKIIKDSECKLKFLYAMKEYLTFFLDNERLNIVGGQKEHSKLMEEACENLEEDFVQIKNLYALLTKEITGKVTKKMYKELYHPEYLYDLEEQEKEFENNIIKLNVMGTVIYPDYWRIQGMQKIFETFKENVSNIYQRDLSEYEPVVKYEEEIITEENDKSDLYDFNFEDIKRDEKDIEENEENEIDEILGFYNFDREIIENLEDIEEDDDIEDEDYEYELDEEDDGYDDIDFDDDDDDEIDDNITPKGKKR